MNNENELRARMVHILNRVDDAAAARDDGMDVADTTELAQATIDEFGLTVERDQSWAVGLRDADGVLIKDTMAQRVVGEWEKQ